MELTILDNKKNKLKLEVKGEDHTFCNALKNELWNDKHVKVASYSIKHPLTSEPQFLVETDGSESPQDALKSAAKRLGKLASKFKQAYSQVVK